MTDVETRGAGASPDARPGAAWHTLAPDEVRRRLEVDADGLTADEARRRLERYGPNEVESEEETPWWRILLRQFQDPLIYILLVAAVVTALLRDYTDMGVILVVVVLNAVIGYVEERRAQKAMQALARMSAPRADVVRDGERTEIPSRDVVPGDLVELSSGVRVPADVRLVQVRDLQVDESPLTGESEPARKKVEELSDEDLVPGDRTNMAFAGTIVTRGRGRGVVVGTGEDTELGRIATAVREIGETAAPLQETLDAFGRRIGFAILGLSALMVGIGLLRGMGAEEIFLTAVALAVAAIPEGLPVVLTVTLAVGVSRMAERNAVVRALPAVETLGSTTVIGSDKTGTLTKNEMTVRRLWTDGRHFEVTGAGYATDGDVHGVADEGALERDGALRHTVLVGTLANEADPGAVMAGEPKGDPTELALHVVAAKAGIAPDELRGRSQEIDILPFESERRFMATLNDGPEGRLVCLKGATDVVLDRCAAQATGDGEDELDVEGVREAEAAMAGDGLRVLAMAYRRTSADRLSENELGGGFVLAGLVGMEDPVRPEAVAAVRSARDAGIRVLMLTGDQVDTARAIGRELGLDPDQAGALEGRDVEGMSDDELDDALQRVSIYARVAPEHKLRIVRRLRQMDETVAVTGDGVNDAPALREADLGIAMGQAGTDVAREASDIVLMDDNFATVAAAVEEGRRIFSNIRKVTFFLLSSAAGEILAITAAVVAGWPVPLLAAQILWINLVTNGLQDLALAFEPKEPGLLRRPPRARDEGVVTHAIMTRLGAIGVLMAAGTLGMFWWAWSGEGDLELARTMAMTQLVVFQFFHVFNSRSLDRSVFRIPLLSNRFLFVSALAALAAHLAVLHVPFLQNVFRTQPLTAGQWLLIALVASTIIVGAEIDKAWHRSRGTRLG